MRFEYCPKCGSKPVMKSIGDEGLMPYCEKCEVPLFEMFSVCVLCVVMNEQNEIALIKQSYVGDNYVGVAGYIKPGETAEDAASREISEELGLECSELRFLKSSWFQKKDMLMLCFCASVRKADFTLSSEVDSAEWFPPQTALNTVRQGSIIQDAIKTALSYKKL